MKVYIKSEGISFQQNPQLAKGHGHIVIDNLVYQVVCENGYYKYEPLFLFGQVPLRFSKAFLVHVSHITLRDCVTDKDHMAIITPGYYTTKSGHAAAEVTKQRNGDNRGSSWFEIHIMLSGTRVNAVSALYRAVLAGKAKPTALYAPAKPASGGHSSTITA